MFSADRIEDAIKRVRPRLLLTVQGDTSTTMLQPLHELGDICRRHGVLFYTDATASFGGNPLETDAWGWMRSPPGCRSAWAAPPAARRSLSARSLKRLCAAVNAWRRDPHRRARRRRRRDDLLQLFRHRHDHGLLGPERLNHHTEATSMLFAARECARVILEEGLDHAIARHRLHGAAMLAGIRGMGLAVFGDVEHRMNNVLGVMIPPQVQGEQVRQMMLNDFGIEIGTSFGPLQGKIWRIGTMGYNARKDCVLQTLAALEAVLNRLGFASKQGEALQAAWNVYDAGKRG